MVPGSVKSQVLLRGYPENPGKAGQLGGRTLPAWAAYGPETHAINQPLTKPAHH
jgi:hypothetical protein